MNKFLTTLLATGFAIASFAEDGFNTQWASGWRLTVGGTYNGNMRTKLHVNSGRLLSGYRPARTPAGLSRQEAQAAGDALDLGDGRTTYPNGAYIDPQDAAGVDGETWNWSVPSGALDADGKMSFSESYREVSSTETSRRLGGKDDDATPGFNLELQRNLWQNGRFGLDLGIGFSFFHKNNWFRSRGSVYSRTESIASGDYKTDVSINKDLLVDPWTQNADGSYGAGSFDGPGPVLDLNAGDVAVSHRWVDQLSSSSRTALQASTEADYEELELTFTVQPYYEVTDWFRIQSTLGVAVSRTSFAFESFAFGDGFSARDRQHFDDWAVYGVGGVGCLFHYKHFCIGADILARFFDHDIDIHGRGVSGSVDRSPWMLRVCAGVEF